MAGGRSLAADGRSRTAKTNGAAAKGIPLNVFTPSAALPRTCPCRVSTTAFMCLRVLLTSLSPLDPEYAR
jgi:hypothetical protein